MRQKAIYVCGNSSNHNNKNKNNIDYLTGWDMLHGVVKFQKKRRVGNGGTAIASSHSKTERTGERLGWLECGSLDEGPGCKGGNDR